MARSGGRCEEPRGSQHPRLARQVSTDNRRAARAHVDQPLTATDQVGLVITADDPRNLALG
jgi:hypothetical protein